jgi:hypothetical protein
MKENKRIAAAIDLRVRQLNLPNLTLPGESNDHTGILQRSIGVATSIYQFMPINNHLIAASATRRRRCAFWVAASLPTTSFLTAISGRSCTSCRAVSVV